MVLTILYKLSNIRHQIKARFIEKKTISYFRLGGAQFEDLSTVRMNGKCLISVSRLSEVKIGRGFIINSGGGYSIDNQAYTIINIAPGAVFHVGQESGLSNTAIQCFERIEIGSHVNIGAGCLIMDSDFHSTCWDDRKDRKKDISNAKKAPVIIGDYVLIGARSIICKGVTIGPRTIIAAGSVVVKDIPADCLAGGNPCKVIRNNVKNSLDSGIVK